MDELVTGIPFPFDGNKPCLITFQLNRKLYQVLLFARSREDLVENVCRGVIGHQLMLDAPCVITPGRIWIRSMRHGTVIICLN